MNISLKKMLEGVTAIPYSEELINILETACLTYKNNNEFERVDELVVGFVTGDIPVSFKDHIGKNMIEQEFNENPTNEVFIRLSQYVVLNTILNNNNDCNKAICASKLMNYMLTAKAMKRSMPNIDIILSAYDLHLSKYLKNIDKVNENLHTELCSEVPDADFPLEIPEEQADDLRLVFKEAELFRIERLLTSDTIQNIENPYVRVYMGLYNMFNNLTYYFYNLDLNRIIELLLNDKDDKKRKKLSNIIDDIVQYGCKYNFDCCETSIILFMVKGKNEKPIGDLILPIKEFVVYLYYELLTEKIIATLN